MDRNVLECGGVAEIKIWSGPPNKAGSGHPTNRAGAEPAGWLRLGAFLGFFVALSFFRFDGESQPSHPLATTPLGKNILQSMPEGYKGGAAQTRAASWYLAQ